MFAFHRGLHTGLFVTFSLEGSNHPDSDRDKENQPEAGRPDRSPDCYRDFSGLARGKSRKTVVSLLWVHGRFKTRNRNGIKYSIPYLLVEV